MPYLVCQNPDCKSKGQSHPNCRCYDHIHGNEKNRIERDGDVKFPKRLAKGGPVCSGPHKPDCEYFADGGAVEQSQPANPQIAIGHAAVHHGLLGLLKNIGRANMAGPEKHERILQDAKNHSEPQAEGQKRSMGHRFGEHLSGKKHDDAAEIMHGHPLVGSAGKGHLKSIMERMGPEALTREPNPTAFRGSSDYLHSAFKGDDALGSHTKSIFARQKSADRLKPDEKSREQLKEHLAELKEKPELALEVGGDVGHYLPDHASALGFLTANAMNYFEGLKPPEAKSRPLDVPTPPDKVAMEQYERQLDIAQMPQLVLQHVQDGTLLAQDMITLQTLYPALQESMTAKAMEALVDAETKEVEIPYYQKQALSVLMGQPLDSTMTPDSMQAIMNSAGPQQMQNQQQESRKPSGKATAVEMSAIDKVDKMERTTLEARQINRNK